MTPEQFDTLTNHLSGIGVLLILVLFALGTIAGLLVRRRRG